MGQLNVKVPRLKLVSGRYYWRTTAAVKALGFSDEALGQDPIIAAQKALALNAQVAAERERAKGSAPRLTEGTVAHLIAVYRKSDWFTKKAENTQKLYGHLLDRFERRTGSFPVKHIDRGFLWAAYDKFNENSGPGTAIIALRLWRVLLNFAMDRGVIAFSPANGMRIPSINVRDQTWTPDQVANFVTTAEEKGFRSMALMIRTIYDSAQRSGDIICRRWPDWDGESLWLTQKKTRKALGCPLNADLAAAINALPKTSTHIFVYERTRLPYKRHQFNDLFVKIRRAAKLPDELHVHDLRRTALTEIGEAGGTDDEIRSVSGHVNRGSVAPYVHPSASMAKAAQAKRRAAKSGNHNSK